MSISDISKIGGMQPLRGDGTQGKQAGQATHRPTGQSAETKLGVSVETREAASAGSPPIDNDRVSEIRDALKEGRYPLVPSKIADAMIAAKLMLSSPQ